jgi:tetratricopeptide (TPR) repeat protein
MQAMQTSHDTEPIKPVREQDINPYPQQHMIYPDAEDEPSGPGCIVWGVVGIFSILLAGFLVLASTVAGWNSGIAVARSHATATQQADIDTQCNQMQTDVNNGNAGLLARRIDYMLEQTPAPDCLLLFIPTATQLYINSLPTQTPIPTETAIPTATIPSEPTTVPLEPTVETVVEATPNTNSGGLFDFDLDGLLAEAETQMTELRYQDAVDTLDAIIAIDPTYQSATVETMYFDALTSQALTLFRSGRLSEGILLTGRAEAYGGNIESLNYERYIAQLYLDAQRMKTTNPAESVRLFSSIAYENGLINYLDGQVMTELQEAYASYGNLLNEQGDYCAARDQYNNALNLQTIGNNISRADVSTKRDAAAQACSGVVPATQNTDPITNADGTVVTVTPFPTSAPQPTIAPIGQTGG